MIVFPNCKINLGLNIIRKRTDGFHDLETVFFPVQLCDALEVIEKKHLADGQFPEVVFSATGLSIAGNEADNLCIKAYKLLKTDFAGLPPIQMHLHKLIPMGAGLGGGSADGAFALQMIANLFSLNLPQQQLIDYAAKLGSDCPFFIINQPCFGTGRGEILKPVELSLKGYTIVLVNPGIHVNTGWAFKQLTPTTPVISIEEIIQMPLADWKNRLVNDFEKPVSAAYPLIARIKNELYNQGAVYTAMSGSGSTVFGIFEDGVAGKINLAAVEGLQSDLKVFTVKLS